MRAFASQKLSRDHGGQFRERGNRALVIVLYIVKAILEAPKCL